MIYLCSPWNVPKRRQKGKRVAASYWFFESCYKPEPGNLSYKPFCCSVALLLLVITVFCFRDSIRGAVGELRTQWINFQLSRKSAFISLRKILSDEFQFRFQALDDEFISFDIQMWSTLESHISSDGALCGQMEWVWFSSDWQIVLLEITITQPFAKFISEIAQRLETAMICICLQFKATLSYRVSLATFSIMCHLWCFASSQWRNNGNWSTHI